MQEALLDLPGRVCHWTTRRRAPRPSGGASQSGPFVAAGSPSPVAARPSPPRPPRSGRAGSVYRTNLASDVACRGCIFNDDPINAIVTQREAADILMARGGALRSATKKGTGKGGRTPSENQEGCRPNRRIRMGTRPIEHGPSSLKAGGAPDYGQIVKVKGLNQPTIDWCTTGDQVGREILHHHCAMMCKKLELRICGWPWSDSHGGARRTEMFRYQIFRHPAIYVCTRWDLCGRARGCARERGAVDTGNQDNRKSHTLCSIS